MSIYINEMLKKLWTRNRDQGNSFKSVTLWVSATDAVEHKGEEEFKWERKRGLSRNNMSKGEGAGQIKYVLVSLCVS